MGRLMGRPAETLAWEQVAFATGEGDHDEASAGVRLAYREAGLREPEVIVRLASPAAGAIAAVWLLGTDEVRAAMEEIGFGRLRALDGIDPGSSVRYEVRTVPWESARAEASAEAGPAGWARLWEETGGRLWPRVDRLVTEIRGAIGDLGGDVLRQATLDAVLGQHDAPWLSAFDGLEGLKRAARHTGWWWPYERVAIVTDRPVELHLDDAGRLHSNFGSGAERPALSYADGFALHAWHGMPVPAGFGATMAALTPERIRAEENAELRRVMLEHFGLDRYLAESGARPRHFDETGVLWRIDLPGDEPVVMVEVVNSTPEPDGTRRTYFLRVPPWVTRAREGVAWTFGVREEDYRPERET
ncbi:hypothetical protein SAMN05421833_11622 [Microbispora rosea]|uniref:DUF6745 domain-containing protein n=1 Tax=Microbispora rosea TaxID=58117 RepID=A0A1N7DZG3_9ACTN|nr:hypothetical protein [Microbispora rosea]GIH48061.1 hypothetical protein Mro03_32400 [Microbispora rosea subsp. rosea]SIR81252.1 hypothetical protein SAMN05421833_11622 [Microbispora rosea]